MWRPGPPVQLIHDPLADSGIIGLGWLGRPGEACDRVQQVGAGHDADELVSADDRQALDLVALHHLHDVGERRVLGDRMRLTRHDLVDPAAAGADVLGCKPAGTDQELEPARPPALGADLAPAKEISLADDTDQMSPGIDHRQPADPVVEHQPGGLDDRSARPGPTERAWSSRLWLASPFSACRDSLARAPLPSLRQINSDPWTRRHAQFDLDHRQATRIRQKIALRRTGRNCRWATRR